MTVPRRASGRRLPPRPSRSPPSSADPVALKVSHPDIQHKTDIGGVVLGLDRPATASRVAAEQLLALRAGRSRPRRGDGGAGRRDARVGDPRRRRPCAGDRHRAASGPSCCRTSWSLPAADRRRRASPPHCQSLKGYPMLTGGAGAHSRRRRRALHLGGRRRTGAARRATHARRAQPGDRLRAHGGRRRRRRAALVTLAPGRDVDHIPARTSTGKGRQATTVGAAGSIESARPIL